MRTQKIGKPQMDPCLARRFTCGELVPCWGKEHPRTLLKGGLRWLDT